jgi:transcriptional regulator with XRE-family HTH domain
MQQEAATTASEDTPVRAARIRKGLTLAQVAEQCTNDQGVPLSEAHLSRIERGKNAGSPRIRAALAALLDLDAFTDFEVKAG